MLGAAGRVDGEHQTQKVIEGMTDTRIGQLVAGGVLRVPPPPARSPADNSGGWT